MFELASNVDQDEAERDINSQWTENVDTFVRWYLFGQHGMTRGKGKKNSSQNDSTLRLIIVIELLKDEPWSCLSYPNRRNGTPVSIISHIL